MERQKEYEMKYRKILIEYHNEPIFDVEVFDFVNGFGVTLNHEKLIGK